MIIRRELYDIHNQLQAAWKTELVEHELAWNGFILFARPIMSNFDIFPRVLSRFPRKSSSNLSYDINSTVEKAPNQQLFNIQLHP